ncbi:hypothetical protein [Nesterenkonia sp. CF4.4]|uniref:hypothetical protein n=1 Tax=Nesterenkonia sp. CF4.4 TaxID=3373079 RepID=UPI003EE7F1D6
MAGRSASVTKPESWARYSEALHSEAGVGLGFMLGGGFACIDLDHCFEDGILLPWAAEVVAANPDTFTEISMSGEGLHIFGMLDEAKGDKIRDGRNIEVYSRERYIALTGNRFNRAPLKLAPLSGPL